METPLAQMILFGIQEAIKLEPLIAAELQQLFAKGDPTPEDWAASRARIASKGYFQYVPKSDLPQK